VLAFLVLSCQFPACNPGQSFLFGPVAGNLPLQKQPLQPVASQARPDRLKQVGNVELPLAGVVRHAQALR
jgi:hypothetical protein